MFNVNVPEYYFAVQLSVAAVLSASAATSLIWVEFSRSSVVVRESYKIIVLVTYHGYIVEELVRATIIQFHIDILVNR